MPLQPDLHSTAAAQAAAPGPARKHHIPYGRQSIDEADIAAVSAVLRSPWLTQGPEVGAFEDALAARAGAAHAVAFSSGTAALLGAYHACGVGRGDEIVTTPLSFVATASAALWLGARVRFADVEPETLTLDPHAAEAAIGRRTKAIVPVDFAGHPADLDALRALARRHGLALVEDACHSLGATYRGKPVGALADATVFSFHPVKVITTGEGGAVLTASRARAVRLRRFRDHGIVRGGEPTAAAVRSLGGNFRLTDIQAALGRSQLRRLDEFIARRRALAARYLEALADLDEIELPRERPGMVSAWHLFVLRLRLERLRGGRRAMIEALRARGIGVQVHYRPIYLHPYFRKLGYRPGLCPVAEAVAPRLLTIPLHPALGDEEAGRVIAAVREAIGAARVRDHAKAT